MRNEGAAEQRPLTTHDGNSEGERMAGDDAPHFEIAPEGLASGGGPWRMSFSVGNTGDDDVELLEAWMPHVVLRAPSQDLSATPALAPGASERLDFNVSYQPREDASEPANPFVFLRVRWRGAEWRVLTQLALRHGDDGAPVVQTAVITTHRVGFSAEV
jgi:hypothetical protein